MQLRTPQPAISPFALWLLLALPSMGWAAAGGLEPAAGGFKITVDEPGVYRVSYQDLVDGGLDSAFLPSSALSLTRGGEPVPIWVEDGGDGRFGRGDWLELVADDSSATGDLEPQWTVFLLQLARGETGRMRAEAVSRPASRPSADTAAASSLGRLHLEEESLFLRFPGESPETSEVWYWSRLTPLDDLPFTLPLGLAGLDRSSDRPLRLRLRLRGWSHLPRSASGRPSAHEGLPDHRLEVRLAGRRLGIAEWSNQEGGFLWESPPVSAHELAGASEALELSLAVMPRTLGDAPLVDVAMLDWVEVLYPRRDRLNDQVAARLLPQAVSAEASAVSLELIASARGLTVYTADGRRIEGARAGGTAAGETSQPSVEGTLVRYSFPSLPAGDRPWSDAGVWAAAPDELRRPRSIRKLRASGLRDRARHADYVMIVHPSLADAVAPLAAAHRHRGLAVEVVDVGAIYDEFGHGVAGPHAIRDFLRWAHAHWQPPALRYVLLAGDASWDTRNRRVRRYAYADRPYLPGRGKTLGSRRAPTYENATGRNDRNLVPTGSTATFEGHAASDAWLARIDDDDVPDLAIGRFPAASRAEARAMVAKTLRYLEQPRVGPWRRAALFISDGNRYIDDTSARLSQNLTGDGFESLRVRPEEHDASPEARRDRLVEALDRGPLLVHFFGHGGRNIWRTGGRGGEAARDLFTLDDLDRLTPRDSLPLVLSMSCYSAPFDHPSADSIGEKFFRLPGRGAVAVIAASWRNTPTESMSRLLTEELVRSGTIGEALLHAKRRSQNPEFVGQYNLLGDPALSLQLPGRLRVSQAVSRRERLPMVLAELPGSGGGSFSGQAIVDWLDRSGQLLQRQELALDRPRLSVLFPGTAGQLHRLATAQVYLWSEKSGRDALGSTSLAPLAEGAGGRQRSGKLRLAQRRRPSTAEVQR